MTKNEVVNYEQILNYKTEKQESILDRLPTNKKVQYAIFKNKRKVESYLKDTRKEMDDNNMFLSEDDAKKLEELKTTYNKSIEGVTDEAQAKKLYLEMMESNKELFKAETDANEIIQDFLSEEEEDDIFFRFPFEDLGDDEMDMDVSQFIFTYMLKED